MKTMYDLLGFNPLPPGTSLTPSDKGIVVYVVVDMSGVSGGVYVSVERAVEYIRSVHQPSERPTAFMWGASGNHRKVWGVFLNGDGERGELCYFIHEDILRF